MAYRDFSLFILSILSQGLVCIVLGVFTDSSVAKIILLQIIEHPLYFLALITYLTWFNVRLEWSRHQGEQQQQDRRALEISSRPGRAVNYQAKIEDDTGVYKWDVAEDNFYVEDRFEDEDRFEKRIYMERSRSWLGYGRRLERAGLRQLDTR
ncbi:MAG: hypothetical protein Q9160_003591 [Pyrenula sp. 1 TL-2023]